MRNTFSKKKVKVGNYEIYCNGEKLEGDWNSFSTLEKAMDYLNDENSTVNFLINNYEIYGTIKEIYRVKLY